MNNSYIYDIEDKNIYRSWTIYKNVLVAVKRCDKSFYKDNSTGLPKGEVCDFWGVDYNIKKRPVVLRYHNRDYKAYVAIKCDSSKRAILKWYQDLGNIFKYESTRRKAVCFRKINESTYLIDILSYDSSNYIYDFDDEKEGSEIQTLSKKYERSPVNRMKAIIIHGLSCQACGFNFEIKYGELGKNFIEVHHLIPLFEQKEEKIINPETDLVCLCSNCHRMIHRIKSIDYSNSLNELTKIIND